MINLFVSIEFLLAGLFFIFLYFTKSDLKIIKALKTLFSYSLIGSNSKRILLYAVMSLLLSAFMIISYYYSDDKMKSIAQSDFPEMSQTNWVFFAMANVIMVVILCLMTMKKKVKNN
jgi:hypothetical protein